MGFISRRPILPAPTDSLLGSSDETGLSTDVGTDLSRRSDKTSETIPEDGRPITITTSHKPKKLGKLTKSSQQSQTSLLIEYFEAGKGPDPGQRRPSLRVRVTPSKSRKSRDKGESHLLVTETKLARQPSLTHRIPLGGNETLAHNLIEGSISSLDSAGRLDTVAPLEIEVLPNDGSELSGRSVSPELGHIIPGSDISSMPAESSLGPSQPATMSKSTRSESFPTELQSDGATLKPPILHADRNLSNERITQKVIEKLSNKPRISTRGKRSSSSRSSARELDAVNIEPRIRVTKTVDDESMPSATASSLVSGSNLSSEPGPMDQRSVRSGASNVSITNNPKLLQTVEDAIRRLILPELNEIKRDQRHSHRSRPDKASDPSDISTSTISHEDKARRRSSGSKSKRRVSRESESGLVSTSSRRHRRPKRTDYDSASEQSYGQSETSSLHDEKRSHRNSRNHHARDVAAAALGGAALTAAALKSHESGSSLEYSEHRRRRRSKSRSSRTTSIAEKDDVFSKHKVPPMPFISEIGTDMTRSSLQSSNDGGVTTSTQREVQEVVRGSPNEGHHSGSHTPTQNSVDLKRGLGTYHGNFSEHDLSAHDLSKQDMRYGEDEEQSHHDEIDFTTHGFAALTDPERARAYERNLHKQHPIRRGLSPIQSVASYTTTEPNRNSLMQQRSSESMASFKKNPQMDDQVSISSISSAPSTDLARSRRPHGFSLENRSVIMAHHGRSPKGSPRQLDPEAVFDEQHLENESYRDSPYIDKVTAGQQVAQASRATAEYANAPSGIESAVASLCDPSVVDVHSAGSSHLSQTDSMGAGSARSPRLFQRDYESRHSGSPLKHQISRDSQSERFSPAGQRAMAPSPLPRLRSAEQMDDRSPRSIHSTQIPSGDVVDTQAERSPESDITTNPSIIRGPIGGLTEGNTDHWPYDPTPPRSQADLKIPLVSRDIGSASADLVPEALSINREHEVDPKRDHYMKPQPMATPPGAKDEGYETAANARSPGLYSQGPGAQNDRFTPDPSIDHDDLGEDPFTTQRDQYVSGLSHGLSPMYDSATGRGRDHIQSKDIVALMDHLTVRDAQRNARDTEILVTLVRSAAEMRNSFEDMKSFIAKQDEAIIDASGKQHERTQKIVGGPRPQPTASTVRPARSAASEEDLPSKRRNVFHRALRGLGTKNTQELHNIEGMLIRLLDEVEGLRVLQNTVNVQEQPRSTSMTSADIARAPTDTGYEPEGQAGTSSTGDRSGFFSNNSSRQADHRNYSLQRGSGNRVSTVMEGDEDYDEYAQDLGETSAGNVRASGHTPATNPLGTDGSRHVRGDSVPLNTPPRPHDHNMGSLSNENTPRLSGEGSGRKHKSFAASLLPKMVSRWSKTTTSSADNYRNSTHRIQPYSGSNFGEYDYEHEHEHDPHVDEGVRSNASSDEDAYHGEQDRPPSPLIPSQVSDNPKYQAHRNSVNLQHPQPRQGPTGRFQSRLESEAQNYNDQLSPTSQISSQWDNHSAQHNTNTADAGYGDPLSPVSDVDFSGGQRMHHDNRSLRSGNSQGPPRPPKVLNDEPLVPQRPPKVLMSPPQSQRQSTYVDHVAAARAGSPALDKSPVAALRSPQGQGRKPSGPRPLATGGSKGDANTIKRARFRGSPHQIDSDDEATAAY
ncbi:hypothetical protein A1O1_00835 [Capronia coronata CBS 617.96]|uniref:Uncharacterized protein n=1 Tax=Capronia coronata CBS 617.96 TaxID=1182541 RepID=W9YS28_9EURO|nr:uncharacterized protein A1O1_00835 [Capronia coronata CBS 617.96]EXJ95712.1 hypothetical protein A1O1_00835 [Capronia coronata CBS 617.96]